MRVRRPNDGLVVATDVRCAQSMASRLVGLLGTNALTDGAGLWLVPGGGVHTLGMRFAIDVLFLDAGLLVLGICPRLQPGRLSFAPRGTRSTLELVAGRCTNLGLRVGDQLAFD